jgi:hypothetical protein
MTACNGRSLTNSECSLHRLIFFLAKEKNMEALLNALELEKSFQVTRKTTNRIAHKVLIHAANHCGLKNALSMLVLLSLADDIR